ncbi:TlpA family protein disulfide reductase [Pedobacter frigoris]|uniref:TlpA family protein disulfide reductase n=1 Tax=Pedobacter frigoris TaxID=2571272 RepID=A0A4U1CHV9_9SPHI|nr:TlpA disulfide reductase family protein [Pedobacter frigoris]TKC04217.1 TlpA family protein disulfide reductase [Pedobacter frigoris]
MKKILKWLMVILVYLTYLQSDVAAQSVNIGKDPVIGEKFPEYEFEELDNSEKPKIDGGTYKGKWMVLDFWSEWCGSCIRSMPKMTKIQEQFKEKAKIIMVGTYANSKYSSVKSMKDIYARMVKSFGVNLTIAYDDKLETLLNVRRLPDIFIIDPDGILRARISTLTPEYLDAIMHGEKKTEGVDVNSKVNRNKAYVKFDANKPLLVADNGGNDSNFVFRSIIVPHSDLTPPYRLIFKPGRMEIIDVPLTVLYKFAMWGVGYWDIGDKQLYENCYSNPILSLKDSADFYTAVKLQKYYSYSFIYPVKHVNKKMNLADPKDNPALQSRILYELNSNFGYNVRTEKRMMPCYRLSYKSKGKKSIITFGGSQKYEKLKGSWAGIKLVNYPVKTLIEYIYYACRGSLGLDSAIPIINETGISENVDIEVWGTSFSDIQVDLERNGFSLKLDKKEMECVVISYR